jgi:transcriptional regulator with XRE-family HTH domain
MKGSAIRLKEVREGHFLSQADLSHESGIGKATIARIETGKQLPHLGTVRRLAKALQVDPREIVPEPSLLRRRISLRPKPQ